MGWTAKDLAGTLTVFYRKYRIMLSIISRRSFVSLEKSTFFKISIKLASKIIFIIKNGIAKGFISMVFL